LFFCKTAKIIGGIGVALGLLRCAMGVFVAFSNTPAAASARYLGSKTSGQVIDQGIYWVAVAVVIGAIGEIGTILTRPVE
jgi:hypothetical protein